MDNIKEQFAAQLGFNIPSAEDIINRDDYKTEAEYILALADTAAKLDNPSVKAAFRKAGVKAAQPDEKQERERQKKEYAEIRKTVKLDSFDEQTITDTARRKAREDLAAGRISPFELGERISYYAEYYSSKTLDTKAANAQVNAELRRKAGIK